MAIRSRSPRRSGLHWWDRLELYGALLLMAYLIVFAVLSAIAPDLARPMVAVPKMVIREGGNALLSLL